MTLCEECRRPQAGEEDYENFKEGEGDHLCWGGYGCQEAREKLIDTLVAERDRLRDELEDWRNDLRGALDPCADEQHCSCVPLLVKAARNARAEAERLRAAYQEARRVHAELRQAIDDGDDDGEHYGLVRHRRALYQGQAEVLSILAAAQSTPNEGGK